MSCDDCPEKEICCVGKVKTGSISRPVCVECVHLHGHGDGHGADKQSQRRFLVEDDCRVVFCLTGKISWMISTNSRTDEYSIRAGRFGFYACPGRRCYATCSTREGAEILQLLFPYKTLTALLGEKQLPPAISEPGSDMANSGIVQEITPPMNRIVKRIMDALQYEPNSILFLQAKALELLWFFNHSRIDSGKPSISGEDYKAIQKTRRILENNLESPPSLPELAGQVGMSASKLKNLFPKLYGLPPYELLRKMRMEKAMTLLTRGGANVTEAAMEVGYSSISHFSKAFYKEFAIYPSQVRLRR